MNYVLPAGAPRESRTEAQARREFDDHARQAATALTGTLVGLELAGRREAALHLADALDLDMLTLVNRVLDDTVLPVLIEHVRERVARGGLPRPDVVGRPGQSWRDRVRDALEVVLGENAPGVDVDVLVTSDAYDALVARVQDRCLDDDVEPAAVLRRLDRRTLAAAERMDDPAAWLTAQVRDLPELTA
ncbi:MAG: hypothetical protein HOV94_39125 [Saccharothrix sp.]|nr:hypothetical protein [Saccharothrix sp.]